MKSVEQKACTLAAKDKGANPKKQRLDVLISKKYPSFSRKQIQSFIMQGKAAVNKRIIEKPGVLVDADADISFSATIPQYVSRAGLKLEHALTYFDLDVTGMTALDAGISTGGFTDCLLQHGATRVYGVDVGYGQVHEKLRQDKRVVILEKTNLRYLTSLPTLVDFVSLDLSFISVLKVIPAIETLTKSNSNLIILIKPQFEAERKDIARGGLVKDQDVHKKVITKVKDGLEELSFCFIGSTESPIVGEKSGNKEFLAYFKKK